MIRHWDVGFRRFGSGQCSGLIFKDSSSLEDETTMLSLNLGMHALSLREESRMLRSNGSSGSERTEIFLSSSTDISFSVLRLCLTRTDVLTHTNIYIYVAVTNRSTVKM